MREFFSSTIGTFAISILLHAKKERFATIWCGAVLSCSIYLSLKTFSSNTFLCTLLPAAAVTLYSEICARLFFAPVTVYLTGSIIPLLPGSLFYTSMHHLISYDIKNFLLFLGEAIKGALGIGIGIIGMTLFLRYFWFSRKADKTHQCHRQ